MFSRRVARILILLGLLLVTIACGWQQPPAVVKIGLLGPFEGERRALGYDLLPAIFAATPASVQGQEIEWVILDTHSDPTTAAQRARELIADSEIVLIVGPLLPEEAAAVAPIVAEAQITWLPLAPVGDEGLAAWAGEQGAGLSPTQQWEPDAWPAIQRGEIDTWLEVSPVGDTSALAAELGALPSSRATLAWATVQHAFTFLAEAPRLGRAEIYTIATDYPLLPPRLRTIP